MGANHSQVEPPTSSNPLHPPSGPVGSQSPHNNVVSQTVNAVVSRITPYHHKPNKRRKLCTTSEVNTNMLRPINSISSPKRLRVVTPVLESVPRTISRTLSSLWPVVTTTKDGCDDENGNCYHDRDDDFVKEDQDRHAIINQVIYEGLGQRATSPLEDESSSSFEDPDLPRRALFPE